MDFQKLVDLYQKWKILLPAIRYGKSFPVSLRRVPAEDIKVISYLTLKRIASEYEDVVLGWQKIHP